MSPLAATTYAALDRHGAARRCCALRPATSRVPQATSARLARAGCSWACSARPLAYIWFYDGVHAIGPARTAVFVNLVPIVAITFAVLLLGEPLELSMIVGAALVVVRRVHHQPARAAGRSAGRRRRADAHAADSETQAADPRHDARVRAGASSRRTPRAGIAKRHFPREELRALGELGAMGMVMPERWGGAGLDYVSLAVALEEIAAGDGATSTIVSVQNSVVCGPIDAFGTDAQKEQYLKPLARGEWLGCFCLTEPHVGSDAGAIATRAERRGDHYVLNGVKQFITTGKNADVAVVFAVTDKAAGKKGISAFIVDTKIARLRRRARRGQARPARVRHRADRVRELRVPAANLLGREGEGYRIALSNLEAGRIGIAAQAVGMARAAFEAALAYARERTSFGKPITEHQAVNFKLADMATEIEVARQLVWHAAALRDAGCPASRRRRWPSSSPRRWPSASAPPRSRSTAATATSTTFRSSASTATCACARSTKARATSSGWSSAARSRVDGGRHHVPAPLDFYFDFSSPYGYLASQKIEALAAKHGRTVDWRPILLGVVFKQTGTAPLTDSSAQGRRTRGATSSAARASTACRVSRCRRGFRFPRRRPRASCSGRRRSDPARRRESRKALYRAFFVDDVDISAPDNAVAVAAKAGVDADGAHARPSTIRRSRMR